MRNPTLRGASFARLAALSLAAIASALGRPAARADSPQRVQVLFEVRRASVESREEVQGSGSIAIGPTARGGGGGLEASSTATRARHSTRLFTVVQDGGSSTVSVATRVPYEEVVFFHDYLTGAGHVAAGVAFENVGTALRVSVQVLPENRIRVRLEPTVSWFSPDGSGAIDVTEAASELVVRSGEPVALGGATTELHELTRRILGLGAARGRSETTLVVTASIL